MVPFIYKHCEGSLIKKETFRVKFTPKVYSKGCMTGSPLSCTSLKGVISSPQHGYRYLRKMKEIYISSPQYGYRYLSKMKKIYFLSRSMEADI